MEGMTRSLVLVSLLAAGLGLAGCGSGAKQTLHYTTTPPTTISGGGVTTNGPPPRSARGAEAGEARRGQRCVGMAEEIFHDNLVDMEGPVQIIFREQLHWDANGNLTVDQEINRVVGC
jgi:hypothetical protein